VRNYQFGDDVRNIDWNVTARTGDPHVKIFEEERELTVLLLVDVSGSSFFGTQGQFKNELITELCAVLAFSAIQNNDKVGVIFFSDVVEKYIPPKKGRQHILRIIRELIDFQPSGEGTDIGKTLEFFNNVIKKRSICFVLSDFLAKNYENPLRIAARRHDIIGIHLVDPREQSIPNIGLIRAIDPETKKLRWVDTGSKKERMRYESSFEAFEKYFKTTFYKSGADVLTINTNSSYVNTLLKFFKRRSK